MNIAASDEEEKQLSAGEELLAASFNPPLCAALELPFAPQKSVRNCCCCANRALAGGSWPFVTNILQLQAVFPKRKNAEPAGDDVPVAAPTLKSLSASAIDRTV